MHPIREPHHSGMLQVSDIHQIYWEESGNPQGIPVVFLHGGPGAGTVPAYRSFFNPERYRIVMLDQRGAGRSLPYGETRGNTTWDLVADIEKLRGMLGIGSWLVFGGSWGSTLALAYAQSHPDKVRGLILRGIFLGRQSEVEWIYEAGGASRIYPAQWQNYLNAIAPEKRGSMVEAYHELLFGDDRAQSLRAAKAWADWESWLIRFEPQEPTDSAEEVWAWARIENHYFTHRCWLDNGRALLANIDKIRHIPTVIVQGRYDMCTPMQSAWELHQAFPEAELRIVQGGHASLEGEVAQGLKQAADEFIHRLA